MAETLTIPERFNGPLESGNGGYSAGVIAGLLGGPAEVSLRSPVPLGQPLDVERANGHSLRVLGGGDLVAEAKFATALDITVPEPVSVADARRAAGRYRGRADGIFSCCFVCGRAREDSFEVFAGEVDGRELVASPWTPPAWTADEHGRVRPEFVWAALDCPTYFALYANGELPLSFLVRMSARAEAPVVAGEEHVVVAWPIEMDGRKHHAGSAVLSANGEVLAVARALLVQVRGGSS